MDQTAIQQIERMALMAAANHDKFDSRNVALVPEGFKIETLEMFDQQPDRHREAFKTKYLSEFFGYSEKQDFVPTIFVDENNMAATAIYDRSTPQDPSWQQHKAIIVLEKTPALKALLLLDSKNLSQDDLIDFAIDWKDDILFWDGEDALTHNDALARLRKLKISKTSDVESSRGDFKASASAIEQIAIDAAGLPLPSHFTFITEPYLQFEKYEYTGQLRALGDDNKPLLRFRLMGMPVIEQAIAEEFKRRISDGIVHADIHIGTI